MAKARWTPLATAMPEAELQETIRRMCGDLGLFHFHPYNSRRSAPGWPDSAILGPHRLIFRELKSETGRVTPEQQRVGEMLTQAGQSWRVWRPSDLLSGQIARELTEVAGLQESLFTYGKPA